MIVFVTEKPMVARAIAKAAVEKYPGQRLFTLNAHPYRTFAFKYFRGFGWDQYPRTDFTRYTVRPDAPWSINEITSGEAVPVHVQDGEQAARELLLKADQIAFAGDPSPSGATGFHELLLHMTSLEHANRPHPALILPGFADEDVTLAFGRDETTGDARFSNLLAYGQTKGYFDYNFNLNALVIFEKMLPGSDAAKSRLPVSKYGLQLLYFLCDSGPMKESAVLKAMATWRGTGRYANEPNVQGLGSPASRTQIILDLAQNGLIDLSDDPASRDQTVVVTARAASFIEALHPNCRDADLPFRLHRWCTGDRLTATAAINRYIITFFRRQKFRLD